MADGGEVGGIAAAKLKQFVEKIERLEAEKTDLATDIREVYAEAKGNGLDPKIMRIIIKRRAMAAAERAEQDALVATYARAIGEPVSVDDEGDTTSSSD